MPGGERLRRQELFTIVQSDPRRDLAWLQSSFVHEPAASIDGSSSLQVGDNVIAVGYPRALNSYLYGSGRALLNLSWVEFPAPWTFAVN